MTYISYSELDSISSDVRVIINTTPVGMYPDIYDKPVKLEAFPNLECVIDAIYNPLRTSLVTDAKKRGISAEGGLYMLVAQAVRAVEYFLDRELPCDSTERALAFVTKKRRNIVLVGMPGCGKSTVGRIVADRLGMEFYDSDTEIARAYGEPSELISEMGEPKFRSLESEIVRSLASKNGCVIATGGGAVLREENIDALKMNGVTVFIDRDLDDIQPSAKRPLSSDREKLEHLYSVRYPIYKGSDLTVNGGGAPEDVAERIILLLE